MPAALFPTSIPMLLGHAEPRRVYSDVRSSEESAAFYAFRRWPTSKVRGCPVTFLCTAANIASIRSCWETAKGGGTAVDFRWPISQTHYNLWVCEYVNADLPYDLPIYGGSAHSFLNLVTGGTIAGGTVTTGGTNGRDKLTAWSGSPPADGTLLGMTATGYLQLLVRLGPVFEPVELGQNAFQLTLTVDEV